jgi:hypothetical protein
MRRLSLLLVAALSAATLGTMGQVPAEAKPPSPRAELVVKPPTASYAAGQISVSAPVKNKGNKKTKPTRTEFLLSTDARRSADDATLGTLSTPKLKPKAVKAVGGALPLPAGLQPGTYRLIACADATGVVKERKEQNNCKASRAGVTLPGGPPAPGKVTVSATATTGGTVATSGVTGGSCVGTFCTLASGAGTVTFTPTAAAGYRFGAWSGCTGFTGTAAITFTNPAESKDCTATFVKQVTISWGVAPLGSLGGSVSGVASNGTCTGSNPITGAGSCVVDAGVGTVTLTASAILPFKGWTGAGCASLANPLVLAGPSADLTCTATFGIL